jgi:alpha-tubulin suppressor-like RCC1 family protein
VDVRGQASRSPLDAQAPTVTQIAASWHILALLSDGTVSALGNNRSGQLGRPKAVRGFLPAARVDLRGKAVQVAAGDEDASYALLEDGTVWAWGRGVGNNLGVRLTGATERHTPEGRSGLTEVARIVAFKASVMAVMRDGACGPGVRAAALHRRPADSSRRRHTDRDRRACQRLRHRRWSAGAMR